MTYLCRYMSFVSNESVFVYFAQYLFVQTNVIVEKSIPLRDWQYNFMDRRGCNIINFV